LILGIIREGEGLAIKILRNLGADLKEIRNKIEQAVASHKERPIGAENIPLIKQAERALKITYLEAKVSTVNSLELSTFYWPSLKMRTTLPPKHSVILA